MEDLVALRRRFAAVPFLSFDTLNELVRVHVKTPQAQATVFLQGAHLVEWTPEGEPPVIFFSRKSKIAPGEPMRGGIPVVFPWFAADKKTDRIHGHPGPFHGFARTEEWALESAAARGSDVELVLTLKPNATTRSLGFDHFLLTLRFLIGRELSLRLTTENQADTPLQFEHGFHTYFHVTDVHETEVSGLESTGFIDKTDSFRHKPAEGKPLRFDHAIDRIYEHTAAICRIHDEISGRSLVVSKTGSNSTVVFNPYKELPDLGPWEWHEMVAVETANVEGDAVTLPPHASHRMGVTVQVQHGPAGSRPGGRS